MEKRVLCERLLKENATVFPYSNMFFPQLDEYISRLIVHFPLAATS